MEEEIFKPIDGYEGLYEISNLGRVKSLVGRGNRGSIILKNTYNSDRYLHVNICKDKKVRTFPVHRLVAKHFCENPHGYNIVNHLNSKRDDSRAVNLEWTTLSGNTKHAVASGNLVGKKGSTNGMVKLTEQEVVKIREMAATGMYSQPQIAENFNCNQQNISLIVTRKRWRHI